MSAGNTPVSDSLLIRWLALTLATAAQFAIVAAVAGELIRLSWDILTKERKDDEYWTEP
jgi:hypothetical protein